MKTMSGKVCMITGATSGIGEVTAREIARLGATVVVVGRNPEKCQSTVSRIQQETGNPAVNYLVADLSAMAQIRSLVQQFKEQYNRLDVLVNNAGGFFMTRQTSPDGYEMTFALNHLNYFLLTNLLLDILKSSAPARIVNVASESHRHQRINIDDLQFKRFYNPVQAYGRSKLANVLFTYELARRLQDCTGGITPPVLANAVDPGTVATNIWNNPIPWLKFLIDPVMRRVAISPEEGAQTSIYLATSPEVEGVTGEYFVRSNPRRSDPASYDEAIAKRLWDVSLEMVKSAL